MQDVADWKIIAMGVSIILFLLITIVLVISMMGLFIAEKGVESDIRVRVIPGGDGCLYLYDTATGKGQKLCDLESPADYPEDVKEKISALQHKTVAGRG